MPAIIKNEGPQLLVTCGECIHFKVIPQFSSVCEKLGIRDYAKPCSKFLLNWKDIQFNEEFTKVLKNTETTHLSKMVALVNAEISTRRAKFAYGMVVYVRMFGDDFISNYAKCYVICAQGRYVYVQSAKDQYYGAFLKASVYKEKPFITKITQLAKARKYTDPKLKTYTQTKLPKASATTKIKDIPSIDDVIKPKKVDMVFKTNVHSF
jgi:hypothetical protein